MQLIAKRILQKHVILYIYITKHGNAGFTKRRGFYRNPCETLGMTSMVDKYGPEQSGTLEQKFFQSKKSSKIYPPNKIFGGHPTKE